MKIILTGSTGFIGAEVLDQCLRQPSITSVLALVRRPLADSISANPKLKTVILQDFSKYPVNVLDELAGAEACVWALGAKPGATKEVSLRVNYDYTMLGFNTFVEHLTPRLEPGKQFRFVYTSGWLVERDYEKPMWIMEEQRRIRGRGEAELVKGAELHSKTVEVYIAKPAAVLPTGRPWLSMVMSVMPSLGVDELSAAMIDTALNGNVQQTLDNNTLKLRGREVLAARKRVGGKTYD